MSSVNVNANTNKATFDRIVSYCKKAMERAKSTTPMTNAEKQVFNSIALKELRLNELSSDELVQVVNYVRQDTADPLDTLDRFVTERSLRYGPGPNHTRRSLIETLSGHVVTRL